jgi:hypothetical protein
MEWTMAVSPRNSRNASGALRRKSWLVIISIQLLDLECRFDSQLADFASELQVMKTKPPSGKKIASEIVKKLKEYTQELQWTGGAFKVIFPCSERSRSVSHHFVAQRLTSEPTVGPSMPYQAENSQPQDVVPSQPHSKNSESDRENGCSDLNIYRCRDRVHHSMHRWRWLS